MRHAESTKYSNRIYTHILGGTFLRLRNKPWAKELIAQHPELIQVQPSHFQPNFEKAQPLRLEIGTGKGQFIYTMAQQHPNMNFIALEMQESVLAVLLKQQVATPLPNLQLLVANADHLVDLFSDDQVSEIYLNFSDPWPKTRHEKRRLTYASFLTQYRRILTPTGVLQLKTDNRHFFEYSLMSMNHFGMHFAELSLDLHHDTTAWAMTNVTTEYEDKFAAKGQPIYGVRATFESPLD
jgi:tRNA (guanine-N7-)-methyltransferase